MFLLTLPVNSYCFFGDFFQVPESHRHGKLTAGGSSVGKKDVEKEVSTWQL